MKLALVGSRDFNDYEFFKTKILENVNISQVTHIVSGGASGADALAEKFAAEYKIPIIIHYAEWHKYGKSAGAIRNKLIVQDADMVIAFWDGRSHGTKITIDLAAERGIQCIIPTLAPLLPSSIL